MRPFDRLPAYAINGAAVAAGIALIQALITATAGPHAAQLALSAAVCTSLADVPNTVPRTWQRVSAAALLSFMATLLVALLKPHPWALGAGVALIGFVAMMTMAWGARAGAVSFAPILAMVFAMTVPPSAEPLAVHLGWNALGAAAYSAGRWSPGGCCSRATARWHWWRRWPPLRGCCARAPRCSRPPRRRPPMRARCRPGSRARPNWPSGCRRPATWSSPTPPATTPGGDAAVLLRAIDLRDMLLASRLDVELLGSDATGRWLLQRVAQALRQTGAALDAAAEALRRSTPPAPPRAADSADAGALFADSPIAADDPRARLLPSLADRLRSIGADVQRIHALLRARPTPPRR